MAFNSLSTTQKNKTYAPIILAAAILLAIFWAFPAFSAYSSAQTELATVTANLEQKQKKVTEYTELSSSLKDDNNPQNSLIKKISKDFVGSEILSTIMLGNRYVGNGQMPAKVVISQISLDRGKVLPNGIYQGNISMNISAKDVDSIVEYLNYLTTLDDYSFVLTNISLPIDTRMNASLLQGATQNANKNISLPVTLGVYYYP